MVLTENLCVKTVRVTFKVTMKLFRLRDTKMFKYTHTNLMFAIKTKNKFNFKVFKLNAF